MICIYQAEYGGTRRRTTVLPERKARRSHRRSLGCSDHIGLTYGTDQEAKETERSYPCEYGLQEVKMGGRVELA